MMAAAEPTPYRRLCADLPRDWLLKVQFMRLSHAAWRMYTYGLMWAIGETDGDIPRDVLALLLPGTDEDRQLALKELLDAGLWVEISTGWRFPDWLKHQSSVAQIERNREKARLKKQQQRSRQVPRGTDLGD